MTANRPRKPFVPTALLIAALHTPAWAGSDGGFSMTEADFFAPMPTVLSASRLVQPLSDAPVAMTVIDREMIDASSATDVPELLRLVPGFQATYTEGIDAVTAYHGFSDFFANRMQVLIDGRSVYDPGMNGVVWAALPLTVDAIERIEVVRGANAAAYGSNAILGTINIVTRSPDTLERLSARAMSGGEHGLQGELSYAESMGPLALGVRTSYASSNGFDGKSDDNRSRILTADAVYRPTLRDSVTFRAGVRDTDFDSESFRVPRERAFRMDYQQLVWNHRISDDEDLRLQFYHNGLESPDEGVFPDPGSGLLLNVDYSLFTDRYDAELEHRLSPTDDWRVSWGAGVRRDVARGPGIFNTDRDIERDVYRLFANVEWHARPDLIINMGLMGEHFNDLGSYGSPRLAVNWHAAEHHTLRLSAAQAYRMPTIYELHGELKVDILLTPTNPDAIEVLGTASNDPERIHTYEIGYLFEVPSISGVFDLRLFHHELDFLLYDVQDQGLPGRIRRFTEAGSMRTSGIEAQAKMRPTRDSLLHVAYAYARAEGGYVTRIDAAGNPVPTSRGNPRAIEPSVPRHTVTALASRHLDDDWQLSGTFYYVSDMEWLGEGDFVDRQVRVDAKLSKRLRYAGGDVELSLNVQNLFDHEFWEFTRPDPGGEVQGNLAERRVFLQVRASLH